MKKNILFSFIFFLSGITTYAGVICIQRGNLTFIETRLDSAILHSQNGDVIYLPGGNIPGSTCSVDKQLTIVGSGYDAVLTAATGVTFLQSITFENSSDGSLVTGIYTPAMIIKSGVNIKRNQIDYLELNDGSANVSISENIISEIHDISSINNYTHNFRQNIIRYQLDGCSGMYFTNNIFDFYGSNNCYHCNDYIPNFKLININSCVFTNNIFLNYFGWRYIYGTGYVDFSALEGSGSTGNTYEKNIFSKMNIQGGLNNYSNVNPIFSQNYHLDPSCIGVNNGTDGTDIGIYGTTNPFKEGGLPYNPHYQSIHVSPIIIDQGGTLGVDFHVETQDH